MKRLYIRPEFQGSGLGGSLVDRVIAEAGVACYRALRLGFRELPPYGDNPLHCQ